MFCGWRLNASKPLLVELGSGKLEIDALTGQCAFQKATIRLPIAQELSSWTHKELPLLHVPITAVLRASLVVELSFSLIPWDTQTKELFFTDGKSVRSQQMHRCVFDCASEVATDEVVYHSKLRNIQEWPLGWPQSGRTFSTEK
jgi:hypothetical protein